MIIDQSVHDAIDDGALTIQQVVNILLKAWDAIEKAALEQAAADAIAAGFPEADVRLVMAKQARTLRAQRLEGTKFMIERDVARKLSH